MANYKTGAQRYNDRMHKIFEDSKKLNMKYHGVDHFGSQDNRSEAMKKSQAKSKALNKKKETKEEYYKRHWADLSKYENN